MEFKFKMEGLAELEQNLLALADEYGPKQGVSALRPAVKAATAPLESAIKSSTPQDSGHLAGSTKTRIGKPNKKMLTSEHYNKDMVLAARTGWTWDGDRSLWNQSLAVEFGTSEMSGSATLRTALDTQVNGMLSAFEDTLVPAIEKKARALYKKSKG
jgi:hypothetical protein